MLPRSRGAIGRSRATPGGLPTAGRSTDGPDGRPDGIPGEGKGLKGVPTTGEEFASVRYNADRMSKNGCYHAILR